VIERCVVGPLVGAGHVEGTTTPLSSGVPVPASACATGPGALFELVTHANGERPNPTQSERDNIDCFIRPPFKECMLGPRAFKLSIARAPARRLNG
jgi:hypothetical protein